MFVILITFPDTRVTYTPEDSDLDWTAPAGECRAGWEAQMFDRRLDWRYTMLRTRGFSIVAAFVAVALLCATPAIAGTLDVHAGARYVGDFGLEIIVDDLSPTYVQDDTPADEARYRARFYVRLTPLAMAAVDEYELFTAFALDTTPVLRLTVYNDGTDHLLRFVAREDGGGDTTPGAGIVLANGWRTIEIDWQASTAPGADDGFLDLWIDGHPQTGLATLDNDTLSVDHVRWGAVDGLDAGTSGSFFLDVFESRRAGYIGLDPVFSDVPAGYIFQNFILAIYNAGVTAGCGSGNYCPDGSTTRSQMAVFLLKAKYGGDHVPPTCTGVFNDVPCPGGFAVDWIEELAAEGITAGCGGGNYCPNDLVTRAQMAVFLLKAKYGGGHSPPACSGVFNDVPCPGGFAVDWIEELAAEGITAGCGGGNFCPDASSTRGQMAVFLSKTFLLPVPVF
jgi:hypothetical protein